MKVHIQGLGSVSLTQRDFIAAGGQGSVYGKGDVAFKVYDNPSHMIPVAKIGELAGITDPNVIRPQAVLLDDKGQPIGYTMRFVKDTLVLAATFTKAFRQRARLTPEKSLSLVRRLREMVVGIHAANVLVVDLNEMNFLVDRGLSSVYAIDVDSYQTPGYRAGALMESVRDRHSPLNHFTELTDWFAFAVVSWQMLIGIHPYKGRHPQLGDDMEARMKANVSVLNSAVTYPKGVVLPFDVIPPRLWSWYEAVFEQGERSIPPDDRTAIVAVVPVAQVVAHGAAFDIRELFSFSEEVVGYFDSPVHPVTLTVGGFYAGDQKKLADSCPDSLVVHSPKMERPIAAWIEGGRLSLLDLLGKRPVPVTMDARGITISNRRLYVLSGSNIVEVQFLESGTSVLATPKVVGTALELATHVGDGAMIQSLLGSYFASVFPSAGQHRQIRLKELDGFQVIESRCRGHVLMVLGAKNGNYSRFIFRLSDDCSAYDLRIIPVATPTGLNFVVHENGTAITIDEGANVLVSSSKMGASAEKSIADPAISSDMTLGLKGSQTIFWKGKSVYSITMRKQPS